MGAGREIVFVIGVLNKYDIRLPGLEIIAPVVSYGQMLRQGLINLPCQLAVLLQQGDGTRTARAPFRLQGSPGLDGAFLAKIQERLLPVDRQYNTKSVGHKPLLQFFALWIRGGVIKGEYINTLRKKITVKFFKKSAFNRKFTCIPEGARQIRSADISPRGGM